MGNTTIEWTNKTWNPTTGCSKKSQGCKNCYAESLFPRVYPGRAFTDVQIHFDRLDAPLHWRAPQMVFVNSMSDLFHEKVPESFIAAVFAHMAVARWHTFQVLTKTSDRMRTLLNSDRFRDLFDDELHAAQATVEHVLGARGEFDPNERRRDDCRAFERQWPLTNVWLVVSVEDQKNADTRIQNLLGTPAVVRGLSCEPLLGSIDFNALADGEVNLNALTGLRENPFTDVVERWHGTKIDWVIAGGESGPRARAPHPAWFRNLRDQCVTAHVPFFFKQWGQWAPPEAVPQEHWKSRHTYVESEREPPAYMMSVGKKHAGRSLDGRTWNEFPTISL